ncbi:MAG: glycosyltransferase family 4 protein [Anaerolineales bacterium]|nr:glycosyltransferase family 4 protein [Anaerolineales bacterium]
MIEQRDLSPSSIHLKGRRIGVISTRFEGTDGVTLETEKWVQVLERLDCKCFYFAGACEWDSSLSYVIPEANFKHPDIQRINDVAFNNSNRPIEITQEIQILKEYLKKRVYHFVQQFGVELLLIENVLAIPLNIPLGLALTEFIAETGFKVIAHHHDFFWERKRFLVNCVWDYFNMAFPPHLPSIRHVVINSSGANQLSLRTGISSMLIPNVMDFDNSPPAPDEYSQDVRSSLGVVQDELLFLQPTRVVPRKGIEHAIELTRRLGMKARLVVSHAAGDEGHAYEQHLREYAQLLGVAVNFESNIIREKRGVIDGRKVYTLADVYQQANMVTYPSDIEGFGNAFLEALYFRRPIVVNKYSIFDIDIKPKGFRVIEFDGFITDQTIELTRQVLEDTSLAQEMAEHNYKLARCHYSYSMLERRLQTLLADFFGEDNRNEV